ncbi:D-glycero-beta-D-manno-heptose-7-phosphate kinase [candidate division KSB1 bacterium]
MKNIKLNRLKQILRKCRGVNIAVIGDVMIDKFIWGKVSRISPEAPVPVVNVTYESTHLGGAANVSNNIAGLGGNPLLFGVVGDDSAGNDLEKLLDTKKFDKRGIIIDEKRPTTMKTRIIAQDQHVVRADFESTMEINRSVQKKLLDSLKGMISELNGIVIQDYNKGVLTKSLIKSIIELANENKCPVVVDPKFQNFFEYKKVALFKPNILETQNALGFSLDIDERVNLAGKMLLEKLGCENVLITRGSAGMSLFLSNGEEKRVPTKARKVHDVSGAGDTVISTIVMILAAGGDIVEAATIANHAAGVVCGEVGIVSITEDKIIESFNNDK